MDSREMKFQVVEHGLSKDLMMSCEMSVSTQGKSSGTEKGKSCSIGRSNVKRE